MDYIGLIINAMFTGIGVALGNEIYHYFKGKRKILKDLGGNFKDFKTKDLNIDNTI